MDLGKDADAVAIIPGMAQVGLTTIKCGRSVRDDTKASVGCVLRHGTLLTLPIGIYLFEERSAFNWRCLGFMGGGTRWCDILFGEIGTKHGCRLGRVLLTGLVRWPYPDRLARLTGG